VTGMHSLRKFLYWAFAISAITCLQMTVVFFSRSLAMPDRVSFWRAHMVPVCFFLMATIFAAAWWTVWKQKPSGRIWGAAASLINLLTGLWPMMMWPGEVFHVFGVVGVLSVFGLIAFIGVAGLFLFLRRTDLPRLAAEGSSRAKIPGDGTNALLNKAAPIIGVMGFVAAWQWWGRWVEAKDVPLGQYTIAMIFVAGFLQVLAHELGHTLTGIALGMKLRMFLAGPFLFQKREGKWEFKFELGGILGDTGGTGVVPTSSNHPLWHDVCVTLAGPWINLILGLAALGIAFAAGPESSLQLDGFTSLFGAFNLVNCVTNLIPHQVGPNYSDGARIYQLTSRGPWADFHRVAWSVGSTLVTPLRPKDWDLEAMTRASDGIRTGAHGLMLRLWIHSHHLDWGRLEEARIALNDAEQVYHESASDIRAELYTVFVFGTAYATRKAEATREWWNRMEAKKPTRFNVDYWRAKGAWHWVEGRFGQAKECLEKSEELAMQLPHAGVYEFDRYCCNLLRDALDESEVLV
jgi:Zn-dependent protease